MGKRENTSGGRVLLALKPGPPKSGPGLSYVMLPPKAPPLSCRASGPFLGPLGDSISLCYGWPCPIFGALPCRMPCCQPCNQKCINQWTAEPFADFLVMASRHGLAGGLL